MAKSSRNRHHRNRMMQRWERMHPHSCSERRSVNYEEWREREKRAYAKTRTRCSCSMCCSPRRTYGNGKYARTFQEWRHPIEFE